MNNQDSYQFDLNMRENKIDDEKEMGRLKDILFPKRCKPNPQFQLHKSSIVPMPQNTDWMRSQIEKLRQEISVMMLRGKQHDAISTTTERAYLDGINKLTFGLKNDAKQINEVFDDFLAHFPTSTHTQQNNPSSEYYLSMLIQNVTCYKLSKLLKKTVSFAFSCIKDASFLKAEFQQKIEQLQSNQQIKAKNRMIANAGKYFSAWRFNNVRQIVTSQNQQYLRENNLQNDQIIIQNLMNLPCLILILEEISKESSDMTELLVIDEGVSRACKYVEGQSMVNSSIETVTQRSTKSALQSNGLNKKCSRYQFSIASSLTKLCIERQEIMFIQNLSRSQEYSTIDNLCCWQLLEKQNECVKGGAVFYPLFNEGRKCIGVLRQYFYDGVLRTISSRKVEKIGLMLKLGMSIDSKMRNIFKLKQYQREGYYMKMISLIKKIELQRADEKECIKLLEVELKQSMGADRLSIYKVELRQSDNFRDIVLHQIWGETADCSSVLSLVDQLMKQGSNYVYLQNRLLLYSNMMLFDIFTKDHMKMDILEQPGLSQSQSQLLPIEILVKVLSKVQEILNIKIQESKSRNLMEMACRQLEIEQQDNQFGQYLKQTSLVFLSSINEEKFSLQITAFIRLIHKYCSKGQQFTEPQYYLECLFGKGRNDHVVIYVTSQPREITEEQKSKWNSLASSLLKVQLADICALHIDLKLSVGPHHIAVIQQVVRTFIEGYIAKKCHRPLENRYSAQMHQINQLSQECILDMEKKKWELGKIIYIYESFQSVVQVFAKNMFQCHAGVTWQKQRPNEKNFEQWKQSLYRLFLASPASVEIDIVSRHSAIEIEIYNAIRALTDYQFAQIQPTSWLTISINSNSFKFKNMAYDGSLMIKLPLYFCFSSSRDSQSQQTTIRYGLQDLKSIFLKMVKSLIDGATLFTEKSHYECAQTLANFIERHQKHLLRWSFSKVIRHNMRQMKVQSLSNQLSSRLLDYLHRLKYFTFLNIRRHFTNKGTPQYSFDALSKFCNKITHSKYAKAFQRVATHSKQHEKYSQLMAAVGRLVKRSEHNLLQQSYYNIANCTQSSDALTLHQIVSKLIARRLWSALLMIRNKESDAKAPQNTFAYFESLASMHSMKQQLSNLLPQYSLFLSVDEFRCYAVRTPKMLSNYVAVEVVYNPSNGDICYQSGSEGQLIWNYSLRQGQNCFFIKDKLNNLSKCIQAGIKNIRYLMQLKLIILSGFKKSWLRSLRASSFKVWRQESSRLKMHEKNRLNDSLYQINLESQTMRQKLKGQQKILKHNFNNYQQLLQKQEQYQKSILMSELSVKQIEESYLKLQNSRNLYQFLHRRTQLKNCFLIWRSTSAKITHLEFAKTQQKSKIIRSIAINSVSQIITCKTHLQLMHSLQAFRRHKRGYMKKPIQRLEVLFQQPKSRLITFQSDQQLQQQNSSKNSNRQQSPEVLGEHKYYLNKFNMAKISISPIKNVQVSTEEFEKYNNGSYKLNPKTLKFLKRMGKLEV